MNDFTPYHVLISSEDINDIQASLQGLKYEILDMEAEGQEYIHDYPREVFSAYAFSESLGLNCKSVIYVENMLDTQVMIYVLNEVFDAIYHVQNEQAVTALMFANGVQISFDSAQIDIEKVYRQLDGIHSAVEMYANVEIHSFFDEHLNGVQEMHSSLNGMRRLCVDYLKPNILQYLNPTKVSL